MRDYTGKKLSSGDRITTTGQTAAPRTAFVALSTSTFAVTTPAIQAAGSSSLASVVFAPQLPKQTLNNKRKLAPMAPPPSSNKGGSAAKKYTSSSSSGEDE